MDYLKIYEEEHIKNGLTYSQIREKYNITRGTWDYYIRFKNKKNNDNRKYRVNDTFFDNIDSEIKSYLLGFLYADGYLASDKRIGIRLSIKDEEIIKLIQKFICPNNPIEYTNNQNIKRSPQVSIRFKSNNIYNKLLALGFSVDKTHTETKIFENIPDNMKTHFIRGFTDGDGCLQFTKAKDGNYYKIALAYSNGTKNILKDINNFLGISLGGIIRDNDTYFTLRYDIKKSAIYIIQLLYNRSEYFLERKKNIAINIIKYCNNTELI